MVRLSTSPLSRVFTRGLGCRQQGVPVWSCTMDRCQEAPPLPMMVDKPAPGAELSRSSSWWAPDTPFECEHEKSASKSVFPLMGGGAWRQLPRHRRARGGSLFNGVDASILLPRDHWTAPLSVDKLCPWWYDQCCQTLQTCLRGKAISCDICVCCRLAASKLQSEEVGLTIDVRFLPSERKC